MREEVNLAYIYDGSLEGFLCCVYNSYAHKQMPFRIATNEGQSQLFEETEWIKTDFSHAGKVYDSLGLKVGPEAQDYVRDAFLTCIPDKEMLIFRFIRMAYRHGRKILGSLTDEPMCTINKGILHLKRESHLLMGFIRFHVYDKVMVACITPKNQVLPLIADHFSDRYPGEVFMIYDKTHHMALVHNRDGCVLTAMEQFDLPPVDDSEKVYQLLWQRFHETIAIQERRNPRCQMNMMPKRYWENLTEFQ